MNKRAWPVYAVLLAGWALVVAWQIAEHARVRTAAHAKLVDGAKDISSTVAVVMRSQGRFGWIGRERLESAILPLIQPGELISIALLNVAGGVVASAGAPIDEGRAQLAAGTGAHWQEKTVALHNLVDLGPYVLADTGATPTIVVPPREETGTNRPSLLRPPEHPRSGEAQPDHAAGEQVRDRDEQRARGPEDGRRGPRWRPGRPPWMSEEEYRQLIEQQGVHSFVLVMSTDFPSHSYEQYYRRA